MRMRSTVPAIAVLAIVSSFLLLVSSRNALQAKPLPLSSLSKRSMADAAMMRAWANAWWGSHPRVGMNSTQAPSATFRATGTTFDLDGNTATQVDTARIAVGQSVLWQWIDGTHSVTNGSGSGDPGAGTLFDQPSDVTNPQFTFVFNTVGTFPFFCRPHELFNMKGVVIVSANAGVEPRVRGTFGFMSSPAPNPSRRGVTFDFAMHKAGRARIEVFDASGRRVALALDRDLEAGAHVGTWDGRVQGGAWAGPGVYYLRLAFPGYASGRSVAITR